MVDIESMLNQIYRELETAEEYTDCACDSEGSERNMYVSLAEDELKHAEKLMNFVRSIDTSISHNLQKSENWGIICEYELSKFKRKLLHIKSHISQM